MDELILQAGLNKKSFALPFHGGVIWCEHLAGRFHRSKLRAALSGSGAEISFLSDYEKAKEWVF